MRLLDLAGVLAQAELEEGLAGLAVGTLYHYRVKSTSGVGVPATSGDFTFTTVGAPTFSAVTATSITGVSATMRPLSRCAPSFRLAR